MSALAIHFEKCNKKPSRALTMIKSRFRVTFIFTIFEDVGFPIRSRRTFETTKVLAPSRPTSVLLQPLLLCSPEIKANNNIYIYTVYEQTYDVDH